VQRMQQQRVKHAWFFTAALQFARSGPCWSSNVFSIICCRELLGSSGDQRNPASIATAEAGGFGEVYRHHGAALEDSAVCAG
jgi:hypothetical protein